MCVLSQNVKYILYVLVRNVESLVMGIKEGTWSDEHWVLYATNESLNTISKTNDVLYVG